MTTPTAKPQLLPCPHCGDCATAISDEDDRNHFVECDTCHCRISYADSPTDAIAVWNRRAYDPVAVAAMRVAEAAEKSKLAAKIERQLMGLAPHCVADIYAAGRAVEEAGAEFSAALDAYVAAKSIKSGEATS